MRMPVKSEIDAFRLAYGLVLLIGLSVALGSIVTALLGAALFAGGMLVALLRGLLLRNDPDRIRPLREAFEAAPPAGKHTRRRVLVVANQTVGGEELKAELLSRDEPRPELRIVVPVLCSRAHYLTSDIDRELGEAQTRLDQTLRCARAHGFEAVGTVGDVSPLIAIEDELRRFGADELIISTHIPERSHWLEAVVERAREELEIPVTHVKVDVASQPRQLEMAA